MRIGFTTTAGEILRQQERGFLFAARNAETLVEAVNTSTGSHITLLASIERVAFTAHVQVQIVIDCRADFDDVTARAVCSNFFIFWVNIFFHGKP